MIRTYSRQRSQTGTIVGLIIGLIIVAVLAGYALAALIFRFVWNTLLTDLATVEPIGYLQSLAAVLGISFIAGVIRGFR